MNIKALLEPFPGAISPSLSVEAVFHFFVFYALGFFNSLLCTKLGSWSSGFGEIYYTPRHSKTTQVQT